ncbi:substrate-binding domain-containing protein [Vibrio sp. 10N.261.51.F12]|uniref:substrate-binding domain-containing protein n=1 Tax=Vibrio sp. 10N.261.51.F12 TaxID=3229679 RepID=UPI0035530E3D
MNIKDVAALASVSPATVSRYLNNEALVAPATASKIRRVIEVTRYTSAEKTEALTLNVNPTIGVVIPSLLNPVFSEVVAGIQDRARHFGFSTIIVDTQYDSTQERQAIVDLIRQRVSGVLLTIASVENNEALAILRDFNFPYCLLHNESTDGEPCVFVNNYQAGWQVAERLYQCGHRQLGMITGRFGTSDRAIKRYQGFSDYLRSKGVTISHLSEVDQSQLDPFEDTPLDVGNMNVPTAWFCSNDLLALKAINRLRRNGFAVPGDISVVGFDGMNLGQLIHPPLATVEIPHFLMGKVAVDILFNAKAGSTIQTHIALDFKLQMTGTIAEAKRHECESDNIINET